MSVFRRALLLACILVSSCAGVGSSNQPVRPSMAPQLVPVLHNNLKDPPSLLEEDGDTLVVAENGGISHVKAGGERQSTLTGMFGFQSTLADGRALAPQFLSLSWKFIHNIH